MNITLDILLMDDDEEVLDQLAQTLPKELSSHTLRWDPCNSFEDALARIQSRRYDLVVTDIYRDQKGHSKGIGTGTAKGVINVDAIRGKRFCPVIAFSDGSMPEGFQIGPFTRFADKSPGNKYIVKELIEILETGIPKIASKLHNELDGVGSDYLWQFLEKRWAELNASDCATPDILERLVRRRAATTIGKMNSLGKEVETIAGVEFYICPKISDKEYRMGEIIKDREGSHRVILTPHCHLTVQPSSITPRADYVLTVRTIPAIAEIAKNNPKNEGELRRLVNAEVKIGKPSGRYWFLPRFLNMPDLYCDFMQVESIPFASLGEHYEPVAVLDSPFAEALQARFAAFYSSVGTPNLDPRVCRHLLPSAAP